MTNELYIGAINLSPYFRGYHPNQIVFMGVPFELADSLIQYLCLDESLDGINRPFYFRFPSYYKRFSGILGFANKYKMLLDPYATHFTILAYDFREQRHKFILELHHA